MADFFEITLADELDFFNGKAIKPGQDGDYPAYGANGRIGGSTEWRYENSIIIGRVGAYCGSVAYCKNRFWASDNTIVAKPKNGDVRYFYYLLKELGLNRYAGGAAQPLVTQTVLKGVPAKVPDISTQRRIASILSAYDDLIENNTRRIAILEEMARRIYEEWFVHFRFPGHEQVKMVESELGLIPEGWSFKPITTIAAVKYGKGLPTKYLVENGEYPVYGAAKIIGRFNEYTCENRTLIVGCRGSVGVPQITLPRCFVTNNSFTIIPQNSNGMLWLFQALKYRGLNDVIGGAAQPQITIEGLDNAKMLTPIDTFIEKYNEAVLPLFSLAWNLQFKNANLRTTRDLLLPKLISGELDVSTLPEPEEATAA